MIRVSSCLICFFFFSSSVPVSLISLNYNKEPNTKVRALFFFPLPHLLALFSGEAKKRAEKKKRTDYKRMFYVGSNEKRSNIEFNEQMKIVIIIMKYVLNGKPKLSNNKTKRKAKM